MSDSSIFERIERDPSIPSPPTKWSVLQQRLAKARADAERIENDLAWMERTPCGLRCSGCGLLLLTEAEFAKHFVLPDTRYLNLGDCPTAPLDRSTF